MSSGLVLALVAVVATWYFSRDSSQAATATTSTATVTTGTFKTTVSASGTVAAAKEADLSFGVGGTVTAVAVGEGDKVTKGQVLATLDRSSLRAALTAARSSLTAAQSQLSDDEDADASDTQLAADNAAVLSAKSSVSSAEDDLAAGKLRSTISGTVAAVDVARGDQVSGSSSGSSSQSQSSSGSQSQSSGTSQTQSQGSTTSSTTTSSTSSAAAVTVVSTKQFVLDATVAGTDVQKVKKGMQAQLTVTGLDSTVYGTVSSIGLVAQTSSSGAAEFPVEIAVTGTPSGLYAGSSATASVIVKQVANVLTVPTMALHTSGDSTYVTKVVSGKHVRATVATGTAYGLQTQVKSGLKQGDTVVVSTFTRPPGTTGTGTGQTGSRQGGFGQGGYGGPPAGGFGGGQ